MFAGAYDGFGLARQYAGRGLTGVFVGGLGQLQLQVVDVQLRQASDEPGCRRRSQNR